MKSTSRPTNGKTRAPFHPIIPIWGAQVQAKYNIRAAASIARSAAPIWNWNGSSAAKARNSSTKAIIEAR